MPERETAAVEVEAGHRLEDRGVADEDWHVGTRGQDCGHRVGSRGGNGDGMQAQAGKTEEAFDDQPPFRDEQLLALEHGGVADGTIRCERGVASIGDASNHG